MQKGSVPGKTIELLQAYKGLEAIYAAFDGAALELEMSRAAPLCIDGCGKCCEENTPHIRLVEANYVLSTVIGEGKLASTLDRCQSWLLDRHRTLTLYGTHVDVATDEGKHRVRVETARAAATCCAFLSEEKRCAIHNCRPLACRAYGVTRLPSQSCPAPQALNEPVGGRGVYYNAQVKAAVNKFWQTLGPALRASYFLPTAVYQQANPKGFQDIADRLATAKMVAMPDSPSVIWQDQLEEQWKLLGVR